jgi:hypothetical protein
MERTPQEAPITRTINTVCEQPPMLGGCLVRERGTGSPVYFYGDDGAHDLSTSGAAGRGAHAASPRNAKPKPKRPGAAWTVYEVGIAR